MATLSRNSSILAGTAVLASSLLVAAAASAQCTIDPAPTFTQNDTGCPVTGVVDTNGGCNVSPIAFQATGTLTRKSPSFTIGGSMGQDPVAGSRDLDWYSFEVAEPCFVNITVSAVTALGAPSTVTTVFYGDPNNCASFGGFLFAACPLAYPEQFADTGSHAVIVTTEFAAGGGMACDTAYTITVSARFSAFPECGTGSNCGVATPGIPGCADISCCDLICTVDPTCCIIGWDEPCATLAQQPPAGGGCGVFVYNCVATAVANDCAINAETVAFDVVTAFDNTLAGADGPNNGQCGADTAKDVWFIVQANADGNMTLTANSPTQDIVLSAYNNGLSGTVDGTQLANNFVGCIDNLGIGGETATIVGCTAGNFYLWRLGIWGNPATPGTEGVAGAGSISISLEQVVFDTGIHAAVCTPAGVATNLGLSSGAIAASLPQRWLAAPFTVADPDGAGPQDSWRVTLFQPEGFQPAGTLNEKMNWILWSRNGVAAPNYATDQVASGQIAYPVLGANGEADIPVDMILPVGDYYLTVFASALGNPCAANDGQIVLSNYAWFIGAPNGMALSDASGIFAWRSAAQPGSGPANEVVRVGTVDPCEGMAGAGFLRYNGLNGAYQNCTAGGTMTPVYSPAFHILGFPEASNNCPTDFNSDGETGSADLSILLNGWGTASPDLNADGTVGSADLSILLNAWGVCP